MIPKLLLFKKGEVQTLLKDGVYLLLSTLEL